MTEFLRSRIIIEEPDPSVRTIQALPTAIFGVVGITEKGPVATPTAVYSYEEFERIYGGFIASYHTAVAVRAFFDNGGYVCWVSRTCHYSPNNSSRANATTATAQVILATSGGAATAAEVTGTVLGPWPIEHNDTLIGSIDGAGDVTATFLATAASRQNGVDEGAGFVFGASSPLTLAIDGGAVQTITISAGTYTAEELAQIFNDTLYGAKCKVTNGGGTADRITIESDRKGTGSSVNITGGTANVVLSFTTGAIAGTGNVSNSRAVTVSEVETILEAAWGASDIAVTSSGAGYLKISTVDTGLTATLQVKSSSTAESVFGLDTTLHTGADSAPQNTLKISGKYPGAYANDLAIQIAAASDGEAGHFNLYVKKSTAVLESYVNLSMLSTAEFYAVDILNSEDFGSYQVVAEDLAAIGTEETIRPVNVSGSSLSSGNSGLAGLVAADFVGNASAETGIYAMNGADDLTILAIPDTLAGSDAVTIQNAMVDYCDITRQRRVFPILDSPAGKTAAQIVAHKALLRVKESGSLYWPRVKILNPDPTIYTGEQIVVPPCGHLAGMFARNDANQKEGPFYQPAGTAGASTLEGVVALETDEAERVEALDLVYPKRINPITYLRGEGIFVDGTRTLKGTGNFPSVGERRGVSAVETDIDKGLQWVRHRNNTSILRAEVARIVKNYLYDWMLKEVFQTTNPATAYYVDVSDALNPPSLQRAGKLKIRIGLATASPIDWVWIEVTKDTRAYDEERAKGA